jgi:hypothetical protein
MRPILLGKYVAYMVCSSLKCRHIAGNLEKRVWAFSSSKKEYMCAENSLKHLYPSKAQALEHTDDYVHPKVDQEVGSELKAK